MTGTTANGAAAAMNNGKSSNGSSSSAAMTSNGNGYHRDSTSSESTGDNKEQKGFFARLPREVQLLVAVGGIFGCYMTSGVLQEHIFKYRAEDGGRFTQTLFLLWVQCAVNVVYAGGTMYLAGRSGHKMRHGIFAMAGFAYILAMVCSIEALKYVSFPSKELGKSCKLIPVMLFGVLFGGKRYKFREYVCVALITAGIVMFNLSAKHSKKDGRDDSAYGLTLLAFSLCLDGVTGVTQERLKKACKPSVHEMMFFMNLWALILLTVGCAVTGDGASGFTFCLANPAIMTDLVLFAAAAACGQNFIYFTIKTFNPLVCTTITTTRKFFTILFSVIYFQNPMNVKQWGGVALVFAGMGGEMLGKYHGHGGQKAVKADGASKSKTA